MKIQHKCATDCTPVRPGRLAAVRYFTASEASLAGFDQHLAGHLGEFAVVLPGVPAQGVEGRVDRDAVRLGDRALRLFDRDPAVQRALQLLGEHLAPADGAFLEQPDRRHIGQCLHDLHVDVVEGPADVAPEDVERPDDLAPHPHREGVHRVEPDGQGLLGELAASGPTPSRRSTLTTASAPRYASKQGPSLTWTWKISRIRAFSSEAAMNRRRPALIGQQQTDRGRADQVGRSDCQHVQKIQEIEIVHKCVGHLDENLGKPLRGYGCHNRLPGA